MSDLPVASVWHRDATDWRLVGRVTKYDELTCETNDTSQGTWSLRGPASAPHITKITEKAFVTIDWADLRWATGQLTTPETAREDGRTDMNLSGETGLTIFQGVVCYPAPTLALTAQPASGVYTGPAETVIRNLIADHYRDRLGQDIVIPASLGRGATITIRTRMTPLLTHLAAASEQGGILIDVGLVNTTGSRAELTLSMYEPSDKTKTAVLSERIGSLRGWRYGRTRPTATRAIVGGGGSGATRVWRVVTTTESEAAAVRWGRHVEVFVDAADVFDNIELDLRGGAALKEAMTGDTFALEASSAPGMRIWQRARLGDTLTVQLADDVSTTDRLRGLRLTADKDTRVKVHPIVGDPDASTPERRLARKVRDAIRKVRHLEVTRGT